MDETLSAQKPPSFCEKLHPMPANIWRPILTKEQEEQQKKDIAEGRIPF
jgi:hypothetical protein